MKTRNRKINMQQKSKDKTYLHILKRCTFNKIDLKIKWPIIY